MFGAVELTPSDCHPDGIVVTIASSYAAAIATQPLGFPTDGCQLPSLLADLRARSHQALAKPAPNVCSFLPWVSARAYRANMQGF
jgi:hypothetical protein